MADRTRWVNKGGTHRMLGKIIKPNQIFLAHADEIPMVLRSVIVPVDPVVVEQPKSVPVVEVPTPVVEIPAIATPEPVPVIEPVEPAKETVVERPIRQIFPRRTVGQSNVSIFRNYSLRERSPGWFDVIDSTGKVVNEQPQTEREAKDLIKRLE
jgi:hypothetical protein